jgi:hypothetical protein
MRFIQVKIPVFSCIRLIKRVDTGKNYEIFLYSIEMKKTYRIKLENFPVYKTKEKTYRIKTRNIPV